MNRRRLSRTGHRGISDNPLSLQSFGRRLDGRGGLHYGVPGFGLPTAQRFRFDSTQHNEYSILEFDLFRNETSK